MSPYKALILHILVVVVVVVVLLELAIGAAPNCRHAQLPDKPTENCPGLGSEMPRPTTNTNITANINLTTSLTGCSSKVTT
jgi:hypothetical protein